MDRPLKQCDYNRWAEYYDDMELRGASESHAMNDFLDEIFRPRAVSTVLDMTCGTGAQAIGLAKRGYSVRASDLSEGMLKVGRRKARGLGIRFQRGDIRTARIGRFDAIISIYCAVGHLTPPQFREAVRNVADNLKPSGLYVFDIYNLEAMRKDFLMHEYIGRAGEVGDIRFVRFNRNTLDKRRGIMHINHRLLVQKGFAKPAVVRRAFDLQIYTAGQLKKHLHENGFGKVRLYDSPGRRFCPKKSKLILAVARKTK